MNNTQLAQLDTQIQNQILTEFLNNYFQGGIINQIIVVGGILLILLFKFFMDKRNGPTQSN